MHSMNNIDANIQKIGALFPNCITERKNENGIIEPAIDFDMLKQELSSVVVEGAEERYQFTWPDKKKSILAANAPINKTLRPCREESVNFDTTENLYIEGDNLEVLKLLQETYLGKVKLIYIDPPYNTGNDFVYEDDFAQSAETYITNSGQFDDAGNRLVKNIDSNGRFHTDWLNMIYPRLKIAKDFLAENGVIAISIDEHELENLTKLCDEIYGQVNHIGTFVIKSNPRGSMSTSEIASLHEYLLLYSKNRYEAEIIGHELSSDMESEYKYSDEKGAYRLLGLRMRGGFWRRSDRPKLYYPLYINKDTGAVSTKYDGYYTEEVYPIQPTTSEDGTWRWSVEKVISEASLLVGKTVTRDGCLVWDVYQKDYLERDGKRRTKAKSIWDESEINYQNGAVEIKTLFEKSGVFDYSKPTFLITQIMKMIALEDNDVILDFFSGSATTAHAVLKLNMQENKNIKFVMIQLPEETDKKSEAFKAGYKTICEIGKERIRRAGKKLQEENDKRKDVPLLETEKDVELFVDIAKHGSDAIERTKDAFKRVDISSNLDIGFRVLKCDSSNMKDVYYNPSEFELSLLDSLEDNIKEDRTPEDLLFQVMLDLGVLLSSKIEETEIAGKRVFNVADNFLIACFDKEVTNETIKEIAQKKPYYFVMRDNGFAGDSVATNFEQIFATYSPDTVRKVL